MDECIGLLPPIEILFRFGLEVGVWGMSFPLGRYWT
jgi:hypothetical protein